jgi:RNA polymerase sigma-70 factor, ECF subfamily
LIRAWRDLPKLRDLDRFDAWLYRLTVNACLDQTRRRRRRVVEVELTPMHSPATSDSSHAHADRDQVDRVLQGLDEAGRAIVVLHSRRPSSRPGTGMSTPVAVTSVATRRVNPLSPSA